MSAGRSGAWPSADGRAEPLRATFTIAARPEHLRAALLGLVALNRVILAERPLPPLYESGVGYRAEVLGSEEWQSADQVYSRKEGDCEDLAAWRAAELQLGGELGATVDVVKTGARKYHAVVVRGDGSYEDPTRILPWR